MVSSRLAATDDFRGVVRPRPRGPFRRRLQAAIGRLLRRNDALAATYTIDGEPGLIIYQVGADGTMNGLWAVRGQTGNGSERLTPAD